MRPWINHDIHRTTPRPAAVKQPRIFKPYPTIERLHELFAFENGRLRCRNPYHLTRPNGANGWINTKSGKRYMRVDNKQCLVDRLIRIYQGVE